MAQVRVNRRSLLTASVAAPLLMRDTLGQAAEQSERRSLQGMNVLLFITDQQRATQHFPPGWEQRHSMASERQPLSHLTNDRFWNSDS